MYKDSTWASNDMGGREVGAQGWNEDKGNPVIVLPEPAEKKKCFLREKKPELFRHLKDLSAPLWARTW